MSLIVINWGPLKLAKIFRNNMLRFILSIKILCNMKYLWGVRLCVRSALVSCLLHLQQWESQSVQLSEELSTNTTPWPEHSLYQTDSKVRLYLSYPVSCVIISLQDCSREFIYNSFSELSKLSNCHIGNVIYILCLDSHY